MNAEPLLHKTPFLSCAKVYVNSTRNFPVTFRGFVSQTRFPSIGTILKRALESFSSLVDSVTCFVRDRRGVRLSLLAAFWALTGCLLVLSCLILLTRYIVFPNIDSYNTRIAQAVSSALKVDIKIGRIEPSWERLWPRLSLKEVVLKKPGMEHTILLPRVDASLYWSSIFGVPAFKSLQIVGASVDVERLTDTQFEIAGFCVDLEKSVSDPASSKLLTFITEQGRLDITGATIRYTDKRLKDARTIAVNDLNATFYPHLTHWNFGLQAKADGQSLDVRARVRKPVVSRSTDWTDWAWDFYTKFDAFDLKKGIPGLSEVNPFTSGRADGELWLSFDDGTIKSVTTDVILNDVSATVPDMPRPVVTRHLQLQADAVRDGQRIELKVGHLAFKTRTGRAFGPLAGSLTVTADSTWSDTQEGSVTLSTVDLRSLGQILLENESVPAAVRDPIVKYDPSGTVSRVDFSWKGSYKDPHDWHFASDFMQLTLLAQPAPSGIGQPGFANLIGSVSVMPKAGHVTLKGASEITFPGVFENERISLERLTGKVSWTNAEEKAPLTVKIDNLTVANTDVGLSGSGTWKAVGSKAGYIDVEGRIDHLKAESAWRYLPLVISQGTRHWLEGALRGGVARNGRFILRGDLKDYPWHGADKSVSHFLATARLTGGLLDFVPPQARPQDGLWKTGKLWPVVSDIDADLTFEGAGMLVEARSAKTLGATGKNIRAQIAHMGVKDTLLTISADTTAPLATMSRYLTASPVGAMLGGAFNGAVTAGDASLNLKLAIPLTGDKKTRVSGLLTFGNNAFDMHWPVPPLTNLNGKLRFTESGATSEKLTATALNAPVTATVTTDENRRIRIEAQSRLAPDSVRFFVDTELTKALTAYAKGQTDVSVGIDIVSGKGVTVNAATDLKGIELTLPAPLAKKADQAQQTTFRFEPLKLADKKGHLLKLESANKIDLVLQLAGKAPSVTPLGSLGIGKKVGLPNRGLTLDIRTPSLSYRAWEKVLEDIIAASKKDSATSSDLNPLALNTVRYETDAFSFDAIRLTKLKGRARRLGDAVWNFSISSRETEGFLTWNFAKGAGGHIKADFSHYNVPKTLEEGFIDSAQTDQSRKSLPSLDLNIADLTYKDAALGSFRFVTSTPSAKEGTSWKIDSLRVLNPDADLSASGEWASDGTTSLTADLELINGGAFLKRLGHEGVLGKGSGKITTSLLWKGSPWNPDWKTLQGSAKVNLIRGVLEQTDLGVGGALLSLVSIQSLIKQISLDFFDLSHTNFTFDSLTGDMLIADGILTSDNVNLSGTKAAIDLSGSVNISTQAVNARATVVPKINAGAASLPLAIINPVIGLGAYVGQWLISQPLNYLLTTDYTITGTLSDPVIQKVEKNPETQTESPEINTAP